MFVLQDFFFRTEQMQDRCGMYDTKEEKTLFSFGIITKIAGCFASMPHYGLSNRTRNSYSFRVFKFSLKFGLFFQSFLHWFHIDKYLNNFL